jgi:hypothetical protein
MAVTCDLKTIRRQRLGSATNLPLSNHLGCTMFYPDGNTSHHMFVVR